MYLEYNLSLSLDALLSNLVYLTTIDLSILKSFLNLRSLWPNASSHSTSAIVFCIDNVFI